MLESNLPAIGWQGGDSPVKLRKGLYLFWSVIVNVSVKFFKQRRCVMEKLSPEKAKEMLLAKGTDISLEQARLVLEFMRKMANIVVAAYLEKARHN